MTWTRMLVVTLGAVVATMVMITSASAHARYKSSTPRKGEVVQASPAKVDVFFTQNVQKVSGTYGLDVQSDVGSSVTAGATVVDDGDRTHISVALQPTLTVGRYVVNWKNVSDDDGDPASGAFSFYVETQPTAADLQKDQALEAIGAEDVTETAETSTAPSVSPTVVAASPAASPTVTAGTTTSDGGSDTTRNVIIIVAIVAVILAVGGGAAYAMRNRMRP